ncbi:MAG: cupin domain-containing protein [Thermomicrobiales bacterium]|nr:cupin domain-containing protein [Thermomicrobiales bacterium]
MTDAARAAKWADLPVEAVLPGITRSVIHGERQTVVRYCYEPGAVFPMHAHPEEQITLVLSGRIIFEVEGESIELGAGGVAVLPANVPHGARVVGDEPVETLNALSPRRLQSPRPAG